MEGLLEMVWKEAVVPYNKPCKWEIDYFMQWIVATWSTSNQQADMKEANGKL
jgi:hypothetical protein